MMIGGMFDLQRVTGQVYLIYTLEFQLFKVCYREWLTFILVPSIDYLFSQYLMHL